MEVNNIEEIKLLDDEIEVIFHKTVPAQEYEVNYLCTALIGGAGKKILITSCNPYEEGKWFISYKCKDKSVKEKTGIISDQDKERINKEKVDVNSKSIVRLTKPIDNGVCKLVTHTCINSNYYSNRTAQKVLIENSIFSFKADCFVECKKSNGLCLKGDYHLVKESKITFSLKKHLPSNWSDEKIFDEYVWEIKWRDEIGNDLDGRIIDNASKKLILVAINNVCKKISKQVLKTKELGYENDEDSNSNRFVLVSFPGYRKNKENDKKSIVYSVIKFGLDDYYIETGLFCGQINLGNQLPPLEIRTEYSDTLVKRMIDRCCGIYVDSTSSDNESIEDSFYSKIVQYMYLLSLRKVISILVPQKYMYIKDRGYNIKGNIDINAYVSQDIIAMDKKVSYVYPKRCEIQSLIDVMYVALKTCKVTSGSSLPHLKGYKDYLGSIYSGNYPSRNLIKNIGKTQILKTGLYSAFRRPLELARMLLENNELSTGGLADNQGISALLMDSSYLWETYLESIMREKLSDWNIDAQSTINYYEKTFYSKENRPDFILTNSETGEVFILDAKFKHMSFRGSDVDNDDIQQLHCYSYYFVLTHGSKFRGTALIYPTTEDQTEVQKINGEKHFYAKMFGADTVYSDEVNEFDQRFGIITLKDAGECEKNLSYTDSCDQLSPSEKLDFNENAFIERLKSFLKSSEKNTYSVPMAN